MPEENDHNVTSPSTADDFSELGIFGVLILRIANKTGKSVDEVAEKVFSEATLERFEAVAEGLAKAIKDRGIRPPWGAPEDGSYVAIRIFKEGDKK